MNYLYVGGKHFDFSHNTDPAECQAVPWCAMMIGRIKSLDSAGFILKAAPPRPYRAEFRSAGASPKRKDFWKSQGDSPKFMGTSSLIGYVLGTASDWPLPLASACGLSKTCRSPCPVLVTNESPLQGSMTWIVLATPKTRIAKKDGLILLLHRSNCSLYKYPFVPTPLYKPFKSNAIIFISQSPPVLNNDTMKNLILATALAGVVSASNLHPLAARQASGIRPDVADDLPEECREEVESFLSDMPQAPKLFEEFSSSYYETATRTATEEYQDCAWITALPESAQKPWIKYSKDVLHWMVDNMDRNEDLVDACGDAIQEISLSTTPLCETEWEEFANEAAAGEFLSIVGIQNVKGIQRADNDIC